MSQLPETGYLRLRQIIGDAKAEPPIPPMVPVGKSTWWEGVKDGRYPKSVKISERCTAWRVEDILALIKSFEMTSQHNTDWTSSVEGNWSRRGNGIPLIVGMSKYGRIRARVGDNFLEGQYDSLEEARAACDEEAKK